jgi:cyanate permease
MADTAGATRRSYVLLGAASVCYVCMTFAWFSFPAYLATIIEEVGLTGTQAGVVAGAVPLTYIPVALFSGLLVDRVGPARSLGVGLAVIGVAQAARSLGDGFPALLALTLLLGLGGTGVTFALPKLVSELFPPAETGFPSAVYLVAAQGGIAGAFAVGRPVLGPLLGGWRPLFLWSGLVTVGYAAVWLAVTRAVPVRRPDGRDDDGGFTRDSLRTDLRAVLSHPGLRRVVVVGTMYLFVVHGMQGWLPTILESRGLSPALAGRTTGLLVAANVAGVLLVPTVADRYDVRREAVVLCGAAAALGAAAVTVGAVGAATVAGVVAAGASAGGLSALVRAIPPDMEGIGPRLTGAAVGFVYAVGEIGGFLGPVVVGTARDLTGGYGPGLAALGAAGLVVAVVGYGMYDV